MKEKLVIIHGWRGSTDSYKKAVEYLNEFEVVLVPLPGFEIKLEKPYTFDDYVNYLEEYLKNFENFYLVGHSFGGALALLYSLKNPQKIKKLILYNPAILRTKTLKIKIINFISKVFKPIVKILPEKLKNFLKKAFYKIFVGSYDYLIADLDANLKETFKNVINNDLSKEAEKLNLPTVLLWGENDKLTPLKQGLILNQLIKNSTLITYKGGHSLHIENPKEFAEFLKKAIYQ